MYLAFIVCALCFTIGLFCISPVLGFFFLMVAFGVGCWLKQSIEANREAIDLHNAKARVAKEMMRNKADWINSVMDQPISAKQSLKIMGIQMDDSTKEG